MIFLKPSHMLQVLTSIWDDQCVDFKSQAYPNSRLHKDFRVFPLTR